MHKLKNLVKYTFRTIWHYFLIYTGLRFIISIFKAYKMMWQFRHIAGDLIYEKFTKKEK